MVIRPTPEIPASSPVPDPGEIRYRASGGSCPSTVEMCRSTKLPARPSTVPMMRSGRRIPRPRMTRPHRASGCTASRPCSCLRSLRERLRERQSAVRDAGVIGEVERARLLRIDYEGRAGMGHAEKSSAGPAPSVLDFLGRLVPANALTDAAAQPPRPRLRRILDRPLQRCDLSADIVGRSREGFARPELTDLLQVAFNRVVKAQSLPSTERSRGRLMPSASSSSSLRA